MVQTYWGFGTGMSQIFKIKRIRILFNSLIYSYI